MSKTFHLEGQTIYGLVDVDVEVRAGETLGLVGESGSGKTTLARVLMGLTAPDKGSTVTLEGEAAGGPRAETLARAEEGAADRLPESRLGAESPALDQAAAVASRCRSWADTRATTLQQRLKKLISDVRLSERHLSMRPVQLSGGLKQRVAIARAFAGDPQIVVCDEPTSALDVSVQAAILNLLTDLQRREDVAYLFISHDLGVVRYLSDRIAVLYLGRVMEVGPAERVFSGPHHPYTEALLSAVPTLEDTGRDRIRLEGEIPSAADPPSGCVFHTRCPRKIGAICETTEPPLAEAEAGHAIRCHIPIDELRRLQRPEVTVAGDRRLSSPRRRS